MGATSVTGTGLGESFGEHKPENTNSCCKGRPVETTPAAPIRKQCATRIKTGNVIRYKSGSSTSIRTC